MIGKLVRHIRFDAIAIVVDHFVWSEWEGGYKVKFLKPVPHENLSSGFIEQMMSAASEFEEVINESR